MANYVYSPIIDPGTSGNVLTSNGAAVAPTFQAPGTITPSTFFYPGYIVAGFSGTSSSGGIILSLNNTNGAQGSFGPYKACTNYLLTYAISTTNATPTTVTIRPYGATSTGNGNPLGTISSGISVTNSTPVVGSVAQSVSLTTTGYLQLALYSSSSSSVLLVDAILWFSQTSI